MVGALVRTGGILGMEAAVSRRREDGDDGAGLTTWPVTVSVVVAPVPVVYGLAGVGWYRARLESASVADEDEIRHDLGYHVGAGVDVPVLPSLHAFADVRYAYVDDDFEDTLEAVSRREGGDHVELSLGATFRLPG
jgi:opacity protein-like surface antigen